MVLTPFVSTMWSMKAPANPALKNNMNENIQEKGKYNLHDLLGLSMRVRLTIARDVALVLLGSLKMRTHAILLIKGILVMIL